MTGLLINQFLDKVVWPDILRIIYDWSRFAHLFFFCLGMEVNGLVPVRQPTSQYQPTDVVRWLVGELARVEEVSDWRISPALNNI